MPTFETRNESDNKTVGEFTEYVMKNTPEKFRVFDCEFLPERFPTHRHQREFWESLGRAVATFGFLEEILGKAIYSFMGAQTCNESEIDDALEKWKPKLEGALSDPLGKLITDYEKAVKEHKDTNDYDFGTLIDELEKAAEWRNILCHGSWQLPDVEGAFVPRFVNKRLEVFDDTVSTETLDSIQRSVAILSCKVINSVMAMGWPFPGIPETDQNQSPIQD